MDITTKLTEREVEISRFLRDIRCVFTNLLTVPEVIDQTFCLTACFEVASAESIKLMVNIVRFVPSELWSLTIFLKLPNENRVILQTNSYLKITLPDDYKLGRELRVATPECGDSLLVQFHAALSAPHPVKDAMDTALVDTVEAELGISLCKIDYSTDPDGISVATIHFDGKSFSLKGNSVDCMRLIYYAGFGKFDPQADKVGATRRSLREFITDLEKIDYFLGRVLVYV